MKILKSMLFCTLLLLFISSIGQLNSANINAPIFNPLLYNPGFTGIANLGPNKDSRYQRISLTNDFLNTHRFGINNTNLIGLSWDRPMPKIGGALGFTAQYDNSFFSEITQMYGLYSYIFPINRKWKMSIGGQVGYYQHNFDTSKLIYSKPDPVISNFNPNYKAINTNFGIVLSNKTGFFGLAIRDLPFSLSQNNLYHTKLTHKFFNAYLQKNYQINEDLKLSPYLLYVFGNKNWNTQDMGIAANYKAFMFTGSARFHNLQSANFGVGAGYSFKNLLINYHLYRFINRRIAPMQHQLSIIHHWALPIPSLQRRLITPEF